MKHYMPDRKTFAERTKQGNTVSVYREILADMETPVSAFKKIDDGSYAFLLESVEGGERVARYSFLGSNPKAVFQSKGGKAVITYAGSQPKELDIEQGSDALHLLEKELGKYHWAVDPELPRFCGGAVGYIGYDMVRFFERLPNPPPDDLSLPDCLFVFTDTLLVFDHVKNRIRIIANVNVDDFGSIDEAYNDAVSRIEQMAGRLKSQLPEHNLPTRMQKERKVVSNFANRADFERAVAKCKDYIAAGDVIQVVISQRFAAEVSTEPFDVYRALRSLNPSPYMYYLSFGDIKLIGSSPEILVTEERGIATTRPIAGTRPRGQTEEEDIRLEQELLADEKERAEHIMLVDLGRNDLGRVCSYGSVNVDELMTIERYSHVMHIVSNVRGRLMPDKNQFDLLRATFPAGTVSGAPKVRAMEIIDEMEPTMRGPYAGAVGYFSYSGDMDTCITIRTIVVHNNTAYVQAGAGIVADSIPENEYQETVNKATAMLRALELAENGLE